MTIIWTLLAKKSYHKNIEFLLENWNEKVALEFVFEVDNIMKLINENPNCFEKWSIDNSFRKGFIHKNVSFFYKILNNEIVVFLFWNNLQNPKKIKKILLKK